MKFVFLYGYLKELKSEVNEKTIVENKGQNYPVQINQWKSGVGLNLKLHLVLQKLVSEER